MPPRPVEPWLTPLPGGPDAGNPDLEYEPEFLALTQAAAGRPETQFSAAEPPSWPQVLDLAEALMHRTRDLRVAVAWGRAVVHLDGLAALPAALSLLHGLLDRCWDKLNPRPDAGDDAFVRFAALAGIDTPAGLAGDLRGAPLLPDRRLMGLTVRDCEIALDPRSPRPDENRHTPAQITGLLADAPDLARRLADAVAESFLALEAFDAVVRRRFDPLDPPRTAALRGLLSAVQTLLPADAAGPSPDPGPPAPPRAAAPASSVPSGPTGTGGAIGSREDVLLAIEAACAYLDRHEPTNPAQWLLRRAARLIGLDFVQLVGLLAPDASPELHRVFGISPTDPLGAGLAGPDDPRD